MQRTFAVAALSLTALSTLLAGPAGAAVTGTSGAVVSATPPASIADNAWTSNAEIRVFAEKELTLAASVTIAEVWTPSGKASKTFEASACLQSHLVHYDRASGNGRLAGSVSFSRPVLAVLPFVSGLELTDPLFQLPGVTYPAVDVLRGFEPASVLVAAGEADALTAPDATTLNVDLFERSTVVITDSKMDQIRVLTECDGPTPVMPEAGQVALLSLGALLVLGAAAGAQRRLVRRPA